MNYLEKLLNISANLDSDFSLSENVPLKLKLFFNSSNEFQLFEGTLNFSARFNEQFEKNINEDIFYKYYSYDNIYFFGWNVLGDSFCLYKEQFFKCDFETGELESMGSDLFYFCKILLDDYNYYTGYSLGKEWQLLYGILNRNEILLPKIPFVLGGEYNILNLEKVDLIRGIRKKIELFKNLLLFKDGDRVVLEKVYK